MSEEEAIQSGATLPMSALHFELFKAQPGDAFRCCFCPETISEGDIYFLVFRQPKRRVHWPCMCRCVRGVVEKRDAKGVSEDLR